MNRRRGTGSIKQKTIRRIAPEPLPDGHRIILDSGRISRPTEKIIDGDIQRISKATKRMGAWFHAARFILRNRYPIKGRELRELILAQPARQPELTEPIATQI